MKHFTKDQLRQARRADLYQYLRRYHSSDIQIDGNSVHPKNNHSLSIKQGYSGFTDFATGETGNSVDYLVTHMGFSLDDAVFSLCDDSPGEVSAEPDTSDKIMGLPPVFPDPVFGPYKNLFAYLRNRGISSDTIQMLITEGILYQERIHNNIIFVNKERDWAEIHGTYTYGDKSFHGMVASCRRDGFWWFRSSVGARMAYVCEAAIDAISLYEIHRLSGTTEPAFYISIGGVAKQPAIDRLKGQVSVILAVDNDPAGQLCRNRNDDLPFILPKRKDWNDDLQDLHVVR